MKYFNILAIIILFIFGCKELSEQDRPTKQEPLVKQEIDEFPHYGYCLTTQCGDIRTDDWGTLDFIDSISCIRKKQVLERYKRIQDILAKDCKK